MPTINNMPSLTDLLKINDLNLADINVTDLIQEAPLLDALAATIASNGTMHKYVKQVGAPAVGFRAIGTGRNLSKSVDSQVIVNLLPLDATWGTDVVIANNFKSPFGSGPEAYIARESLRSMKQAFFWAGRQLINGSNNDANGCYGMADALPSLNGAVDAIVVTNPGAGYVAVPAVTVTAASGDNTGSGCTAVATLLNGAITGITITNPGSDYSKTPTVAIAAGASTTQATASALLVQMCLGAGGTTASTGSSVWMIRTGLEDLAAVAGEDGGIQMYPTTIVPMPDPSDANKTFSGYYTPIVGSMCLQNGSIYSFARIANVTEDPGCGVTDDLIAQAYALFPAARPPNLIALSRRSCRQLQNSRTAVNATGAPAPLPKEWEGIKIIRTDEITITEALLT